jgi:hypothetical protein
MHHWSKRARRSRISGNRRISAWRWIRKRFDRLNYCKCRLESERARLLNCLREVCHREILTLSRVADTVCRLTRIEIRYVSRNVETLHPRYSCNPRMQADLLEASITREYVSNTRISSSATLNTGFHSGARTCASK